MRTTGRQRAPTQPRRAGAGRPGRPSGRARSTGARASARALGIAAALAIAAACSRAVTLPVAEISPAQQLGALRGAAYALEGPDGTTGQVRVWSDGLVTRPGPPALTVSLALAVDGGPLPIAVFIDRARLGAEDGTLSGPVAPQLAQGELLVLRGGSAMGGASFRLPAGVRPEAVACFRVEWHAVIRDAVLPRTTVFVRDRSAPPPGGPGSAAFAPSGDPASCAVTRVPGLER